MLEHIKLILTPPLFIKCLYQARQLSGHVFVCKGIFLWLFYWTLELFRQRGILLFPFYKHLLLHSVIPSPSKPSLHLHRLSPSAFWWHTALSWQFSPASSVTLAASLDIIHLYVTLQSADKTSSPSCNIYVFMWTKDAAGLSLRCLTSLSTIFQLCCGGQFYWWRKLEFPEKTTDLPNMNTTAPSCCWRTNLIKIKC